MPNTSSFGDAETGKESNIYGEMCTEHVPFRYLFSAKCRRNRGPVPPCGGGRAARANDPSLRTLGRAAKGWVEEYGHLAARDATQGRTLAKKTAFRALSRRNNLPRIDLRPERSHSSAVTGP
jgi:hypothetical protein